VGRPEIAAAHRGQKWTGCGPPGPIASTPMHAGEMALPTTWHVSKLPINWMRIVAMHNVLRIQLVHDCTQIWSNKQRLSESQMTASSYIQRTADTKQRTARPTTEPVLCTTWTAELSMSSRIAHRILTELPDVARLPTWTINMLMVPATSVSAVHHVSFPVNTNHIYQN